MIIFNLSPIEVDIKPEHFSSHFPDFVKNRRKVCHFHFMFSTFSVLEKRFSFFAFRCHCCNEGRDMIFI